MHCDKHCASLKAQEHCARINTVLSTQEPNEVEHFEKKKTDEMLKVNAERRAGNKIPYSKKPSQGSVESSNSGIGQQLETVLGIQSYQSRDTPSTQNNKEENLINLSIA